MEYFPELNDSKFLGCASYVIATALEIGRVYLYDALAVGLGLYEQRIFDRFLGI